LQTASCRQKNQLSERGKTRKVQLAPLSTVGSKGVFANSEQWAIVLVEADEHRQAAGAVKPIPKDVLLTLSRAGVGQSLKLHYEARAAEESPSSLLSILARQEKEQPQPTAENVPAVGGQLTSQLLGARQ
jgi:hypothetical protein